MPMDKTMMGAAMIAATDAYIAGLADPKQDNYSRQAMYEALADAIIKHIQSNALVSTTVTVASVSGVTPGAGVSGPGTGTGTGTVA
jgi:hypothetical protein